MVGLVIRRIIEYKARFGLHPLIATDAEIERETGVNRAEIARISQELTKDGQMYYGRTINGKYYALNHKLNSQDIMKGFQTAIKDHLEKMAAQDEAFAEKFAAKCEAEQDSISNCCNCIHYLHGVLENPCAKGMRCVGYLREGCWRWEIDKSNKDIPTKKCSICGKVKEITEFVYDRGRYTHYCKTCRVKYKESKKRKKKD